MDTLTRLKMLMPDLLAQLPEPRLVVVFGSVAKGSAGLSSDLDLAIGCRQRLPVTLRHQLVEWLAEHTGRPVDLIDLITVGEPLRGEILRHGLRLHGSDEAWAELALRHVYDMEDFVPLLQRTLKERRQRWLNS